MSQGHKARSVGMAIRVSLYECMACMDELNKLRFRNRGREGRKVIENETNRARVFQAYQLFHQHVKGVQRVLSRLIFRLRWEREGMSIGYTLYGCRIRIFCFRRYCVRPVVWCRNSIHISYLSSAMRLLQVNSLEAHQPEGQKQKFIKIRKITEIALQFTLNLFSQGVLVS